MNRAVRPRRGRMAAFWTSVLITLVTVLGGLGVLPTGEGAAAALPVPEAAAVLAAAAPVQAVERAVTLAPAAPPPAPTGPGVLVAPPGLDDSGREVDPRGLEAGVAESSPLPARSGTGRRVVFDASEQRVWLVGRDEVVRRTYLVSGSAYDNLAPGSYEVYSRSRHAVGIDESGTMEYMVRFTRGERAAIGFHSVPVHQGELVQSRAQLGTPLSHGCVRQWLPDARALWRFAPVGTTVVVTA